MSPEGVGGGPELRWEITPDLVDLDRLARVLVKAYQQGRRATRTTGTSTTGKAPTGKAPKRWVIVVTLGVCLGVLAIVSVSTLLPVLGALVAIVVFSVWWNRGAARRLATKFRAVPTMSEGVTVVVGPAGVEQRSATLHSEMTWARYVDVLVVDEHIVLVLPLNQFQVLAEAGRQPSPLAGSTDEAVAQIKAWIAAASTGTSPDSPWSSWVEGRPPAT